MIEVTTGVDGDDDEQGARSDGNRNDGMGYNFKLHFSKRSLA